ncbi:MAG: hypothetical protein ACKVPX_00635 [Myxococcaceae bacterium]
MNTPVSSKQPATSSAADRRNTLSMLFGNLGFSSLLAAIRSARLGTQEMFPERSLNEAQVALAQRARRAAGGNTHAIAELREASAEVVPELISFVRSSQPDLRRAALLSLGHVLPVIALDGDALSGIQAAAVGRLWLSRQQPGDPSTDVRVAAARTLAALASIPAWPQRALLREFLQSNSGCLDRAVRREVLARVEASA